MTYFLLFVCSVIGLTQIIVDGAIAEPIRIAWRKYLPESIMGVHVHSLVDCYMCCGTWCGFLAGAILLSNDPLIILMTGFAGSFLASTASTVINWIEAATIITLEKGDE